MRSIKKFLKPSRRIAVLTVTVATILSVLFGMPSGGITVDTEGRLSISTDVSLSIGPEVASAVNNLPESEPTGQSYSIDEIIWDEWSKDKEPEIKPTDSGWIMNTMPWMAVFEEDLTVDRPLQYQAEGRFISFKPLDMYWRDGKKIIPISHVIDPTIGTSTKDIINYVSVYASGIDIQMSVGRTTWRKEVIIDSLSSLGIVPNKADFLEIRFEIETDFDIEDWDGVSELQFNTAIKLGKMSQLEAAQAWDNKVDTEKPPREEDDDGLSRHETLNGFFRVIDGKYYLVKQIPVDYLKQAIYPVITDFIITYGAEYPFNSDRTSTPWCASLDSTHFVVCYQDTGDVTNHGCAKIGVVSSGDEIAYGDEYVFNTVNTRHINCAKLDATHFVVAFQDYGGDAYGIAMVGVVSSGNVITFGAEYEFNAVNTWAIKCSALDSTHFALCFRDEGGANWGIARIGVVSLGDVITFGSEYPFNETNTYEIFCTALDATHFVVYYEDFGGDEYGIARIGVVSNGDEVSFGNEYIFLASTTCWVTGAKLDSTHFVVCCHDSVGDDDGIARIGVVSDGNVITFGAEYTFWETDVTRTSCAALDSTHFVIGWRDDADTDYGMSKIGTVSDSDVIAFGAVSNFNETYTVGITCSTLDSSLPEGEAHFVVCFNNASGDYFGIAMIGVVTPAPEADISNTPNSKDFGLVTESSTYDTTLAYFGITNNSGSSISVSIQGTDMTGGTSWTLSDTATPGVDTCGMKVGLGEWVSPTGHTDADSDWDDETLAYDDNTATYATSTNPGAPGWNGWLDLDISSMSCNSIRFWASARTDPACAFAVELYYADAWQEVYNSSFTDGEWTIVELDNTYTVTDVRVAFEHGDIAFADLYEFVLLEVEDDFTIVVKKNSPYNDLVADLSDGDTQGWGLRLYVPTLFSDGTAKSGTVTLTATCL